MIPRWASIELLNDPDAEWYCMDCSGETPDDRIAWAKSFLEEDLGNQDGNGDDADLFEPPGPGPEGDVDTFGGFVY